LSGFNRDYSLNPRATGIIDIAERLPTVKAKLPTLFSLDKFLSVNIMFSTSSRSIFEPSSPKSTRVHLVSLAKAGDVTALNRLIDHTLSPLGVEVTTVIKNECLVVTAILPETIDRLFLIDFLREALERLQPRKIDRVVIVGRDRAGLIPDWQHVLNLHQADLPLMPTPARQQQAKRKITPKKATTSFQQRHPLLSRPLHLIMFLSACGLLVGGVFAAKTVFTVEDGVIKPIELTR
jgi:hypothetical protein